MNHNAITALFVSLALLFPFLAKGEAGANDASGVVKAPLGTESPKGISSEFRPLQIGFVYFNSSYEEPGVMTQKGNLTGLTAVYEKFGERPRLMGRVASELSFGMLEYNGSIQNLETREIRPHKTTGTDYLFNVKASVGIPVTLSDRVQILGLFGYGFRYLNDQMQGEASYEREISYTYLPIGIELRYFFSHKFALTAGYEWDKFLNGRVKSHLSQLGDADDLLNTQTKGSGHRFTLDFVTALASGHELHIIPYFQRWDIDDSDKVVMVMRNDLVAMHEPNNNTVQYGVNVVFGL